MVNLTENPQPFCLEYAPDSEWVHRVLAALGIHVNWPAAASGSRYPSEATLRAVGHPSSYDMLKPTPDAVVIAVLIVALV